ncbi:leucine-rich repeat domain-containing protein [Persicobacter diffluens]|uniref:Leucine-rich repeat domain-containing protein n=1 Tax=Persicobacter diffluens TaxID=981 RepID=A0AAN4W4Z5_9BACT|nr:hypothetical protein PEDI_52170 [Persicobacter diffluens]GJM64772.1 hypothetical protein PEDI_53240 [Persicobacter diffluens]
MRIKYMSRRSLISALLIMLSFSCNTNKGIDDLSEKEAISILKERHDLYFICKKNEEGYVYDLRIRDDKRLKRFPKEILAFKQLVDLDLSGNAIEEIPEWVSEIDSLKYLILRDNPIKEIPHYISTFKELRVLAIDRSEVTSIPKNIVDLPHLVTLYLGGCPPMKEFPSVLYQCLQLENLALPPLKRLPDDIGRFKNLEFLNTTLESFENLDKLQSLTRLYLKNSTASHFPKDFKGLPELNFLRINNCKNLEELPANLYVKYKDHGADIDAINCVKLKGLPDEFAKHRSFATIYLDSCLNFKHFPKGMNVGTISAKNVHWEIAPEGIFYSTCDDLWITNHRIKSIKGIGNMENLEFCVLSDGLIEEIPRDIVNCKKLKHLNLRGNKIKAFPAFMSKFIRENPNLKGVNLGGNPIDD